VLLDYFADDIAGRVHGASEHDNLLGSRFGVFQEYGTLWQNRDDTADWITSEDLDPSRRLSNRATIHRGSSSSDRASSRT
jgi:hypothetical protein